MKKVLSILMVFGLLFTLSSCDGLKPKEVVVSNEGKKWYVEIIEEHEFLHRHSGEAVIYIHRPKCKKCKLK